MDISWLDVHTLEEIADEAMETLAPNRSVADIPEQLDGIRTAIECNVTEMRDAQATLA